MHQVIVELDDATAAELERVAPARSRRRSAFIRAAIQRALDAVAAKEMEAAYRRQPQAEEELHDDPATWSKDEWSARSPPKPRRRRTAAGGDRR